MVKPLKRNRLKRQSCSLNALHEAVATFERWEVGKSSPAPGIRKLILQRMQKLLEEQKSKIHASRATEGMTSKRERALSKLDDIEVSESNLLAVSDFDPLRDENDEFFDEVAASLDNCLADSTYFESTTQEFHNMLRDIQYDIETEIGINGEEYDSKIIMFLEQNMIDLIIEKFTDHVKKYYKDERRS